MPELTRAADPERGRPIYMSACAGCHWISEPTAGAGRGLDVAYVLSQDRRTNQGWMRLSRPSAEVGRHAFGPT
jgi:cytochrome c